MNGIQRSVTAFTRCHLCILLESDKSRPHRPLYLFKLNFSILPFTLYIFQFVTPLLVFRLQLSFLILLHFNSITDRFVNEFSEIRLAMILLIM
jgi:hypothetical protein